jgi:hypothetical protein
MVLTLCLWVFLYGSQSKQRHLPQTTLRDGFCVPEVDSVYCAVRNVSLHKNRHIAALKG